VKELAAGSARQFNSGEPRDRWTAAGRSYGSGPLGMGAIGLEPLTPSVSSSGPLDASENSEGLAATPPPVCTNQPEGAEKPSLDALAAALLNLSPEDKARLVALLLPQASPGASGT
jgi:hypothetical protein